MNNLRDKIPEKNTCNGCHYLMPAYGNAICFKDGISRGYFCDRGFFTPRQALIERELRPTRNIYIIRPYDCIEAERIFYLKAKMLFDVEHEAGVFRSFKK
jgi:hypothetical protein